MREFSEKRRQKSLFYSYPVMIVFFVILVILLKANILMYMKVRASAERREQIELQLKELNDRKQNLESEVARLNSKIGVEDELRNRFNLMKENEEMIIILEDEKADLDETLVKNEKTFFQKIKGWFAD